MPNRINNSAPIKVTIGENLANARTEDSMTRKEVCQRLNKCKIHHPDKELTEDVLKMWELGRNAINIEWIPALCHVLHCDVGYLFGEHEGKTGVITDVQKEIGLSEKAIEELQKLNRLDSYYSQTIQKLLSLMLTDGTFLPEMYRSFGTMWDMKQKNSDNSPVVDVEEGIYLFGGDAVDAIMFHVQKEVVKFLGDFFLLHE